MKKNILTEISRVREIMGLREQRKETIVTEIPFDVQVPIPTIKGNYSVGKSDPSKFIKKSINTIIKAIKNTPGAADKLVSGDLQLVGINVKAGASNYWDSKTGPTQFDHKIVGDNYEPTTNGKGEGLSKDGYELNLKLAKLRASTYIQQIKPLLAELKIDISDKLSEVPEGMVVYTGGKNDDPDCTTDCGQVLVLTLSFVYTDKEEFRETNCLPEILIAIGTAGEQDGHICDEAIFSVMVNGAEIGIANLNNGPFDNVHKGSPVSDYEHLYALQTLPGYGVGSGNAFEDDGNGGQRKSDNRQGGKRTWKTIINTKNPELKWGEKNVLSIKSLVTTEKNSRGQSSSYITGTNGEDVRVCPDGFGRTNRRDGECGSHTEVPWVVIQNTPTTKGEYEMVYGKYPNIGSVNADTTTTELLTLDSCGVPLGEEIVSTEE